MVKDNSQFNIHNSSLDNILLYQNADGTIKLDVHLQDESVWVTQEQMALLFGKGRSTVAEHIKNVYKEGELEQNSTCRKFRQVRNEGKRSITREIDHTILMLLFRLVTG
jgi:hypothetical protein